MASPEEALPYDESLVRGLDPVFVMRSFAAYANVMSILGGTEHLPASRHIIHMVAKVGQQQEGFSSEVKTNFRAFMETALEDVDFRASLFVQNGEYRHN